MGRKHNLGRYLLGSSVIALVAASGSSASADTNEQLAAQLKAMQAQIEHLQRQIEQNNQRQIEQNNSAAAAARSAAARSEAAQAAAADSAAAAQAAASKGGGEKEKDDLDLKVKWKGAPELSSKDGKFRMKVRGRLNFDYNGINQDQDITGIPDVNAFEIRRARLGVEGTVWKDVDYKFEVDFANDITAIKDAYFEYTGWGPEFKIRVGNFKTFNSLEHIMSANFIEFMERAAFVDAAGFGLDRQIGLGALYQREHFTLAAGVFGPHPFDEERWFQDVKTGSARVTAAPINREGEVLHLGASWRSRDGATDPRPGTVATTDQFFTYGARGADLHLASRFVATPALFR